MPVDEDDDWADGGRILAKYDDEGEIAQERKRKSRIKIGQTEPEKDTHDKRPPDSLETKKTFASDYFTEQEIGLTFKKPSLIGKKRRQDDDDDDIVA